MKKLVKLFALFLISVFCTSCGQSQTPVAKNNIKSETVDSTGAQFRQHPDAVHHAMVHQFTYLVAMRDFCSKTLLQMRANGEVNKELSKVLERELSEAKADLTSSKFNGLRIELALYEIFMKQINDSLLHR